MPKNPTCTLSTGYLQLHAGFLAAGSTKCGHFKIIDSFQRKQKLTYGPHLKEYNEIDYLGIVLVKVRYKVTIPSSSSFSFTDTLPTSIIPKYITNATTRSTCNKENNNSTNNSSPPPKTLSTKKYGKVKVTWRDKSK